LLLQELNVLLEELLMIGARNLAEVKKDFMER
jgi:hypothetical protein